MDTIYLVIASCGKPIGAYSSMELAMINSDKSPNSTIELLALDVGV